MYVLIKHAKNTDLFVMSAYLVIIIIRMTTNTSSIREIIINNHNNKYNQ